MKVNVQAIHGNWDLGYTLDKHMLSSTYLGDNEQGHPQFDSVRTEVGEALFQLKYRSAFQKIPLIGDSYIRPSGAHIHRRLSSSLCLPQRNGEGNPLWNSRKISRPGCKSHSSQIS